MAIAALMLASIAGTALGLISLLFGAGMLNAFAIYMTTSLLIFAALIVWRSLDTGDDDPFPRTAELTT